MKKRTINELRQVKSYGYRPPSPSKVKVPKQITKIIDNYYEKVNFDPQHIVDLIKAFPNDEDLGREMRSYYHFMLEEKNIK
jgi:hypothetical protein